MRGEGGAVKEEMRLASDLETFDEKSYASTTWLGQPANRDSTPSLDLHFEFVALQERHSDQRIAIKSVHKDGAGASVPLGPRPEDIELAGAAVSKNPFPSGGPTHAQTGN